MTTGIVLKNLKLVMTIMNNMKIMSFGRYLE